jgi:hypothetical protein
MSLIILIFICFSILIYVWLFVHKKHYKLTNDKLILDAHEHLLKDSQIYYNTTTAYINFKQNNRNINFHFPYDQRELQIIKKYHPD